MLSHTGIIDWRVGRTPTEKLQATVAYREILTGMVEDLERRLANRKELVAKKFGQNSVSRDAIYLALEEAIEKLRK